MSVIIKRARERLTMSGYEPELKFYALQANGYLHARALAAKSRRQFGEGYQRGVWVIVGPCARKPWAWREQLPAGEWNMYEGDTPEEAAERAGIKF